MILLGDIEILRHRRNYMTRVSVILCIGITFTSGCWRVNKTDEQASDIGRDHSTANGTDRDTDEYFHAVAALATDKDTSAGSDADARTDSEPDTAVDTDKDTATDTLHSTPSSCEGIVEFPDENLEALVRARIGRPDGELFYEDVKDITDLSGERAGITELAGIQCMTGLTDLDLWGNNISNISALSNLTNLTVLALSYNNVTDVSALSNLNSLLWVDLSFNNS
jgi:Leucine-rich repeat (LRR) protein